MIPEKLTEVLKHDGVVAIATLGQDGPHMVNTWNSYVRITTDERILIPVGYMHRTEANIAFNNQVLITLGSRKVAGTIGPGAGFLIKGTACIEISGSDYDVIKAKFAWARAVMAVTATSIEQTL
ncbi:MAG: pyridoxamine 5'-phosphate oxidase family protein [Chlorobiaceae bacterium]